MRKQRLFLLIAGLLIVTMFFCGCVNVQKTLIFSCRLDSYDDELNVVVWEINGYSATGGANAEFQNIMYYIDDENSNTLWSGLANVIREEATYPENTGVNFFDNKDHDDKIGSINMGDQIIIKTPSDGKFIIRAEYAGNISWLSPLENY